MATVKETNISGKEQVPKDSKSRTPTGEMRDHFGVAHTGIGYWGGVHEICPTEERSTKENCREKPEQPPRAEEDIWR